eukprot:COSAG05_NODE_2135_length_3501_cov_6.025573_3_plen_54_part_00
MPGEALLWLDRMEEPILFNATLAVITHHLCASRSNAITVTGDQHWGVPTGISA